MRDGIAFASEAFATSVPSAGHWFALEPDAVTHDVKRPSSGGHARRKDIMRRRHRLRISPSLCVQATTPPPRVPFFAPEGSSRIQRDHRPCRLTACSTRAPHRRSAGTLAFEGAGEELYSEFMRQRARSRRRDSTRRGIVSLPRAEGLLQTLFAYFRGNIDEAGDACARAIQCWQAREVPSSRDSGSLRRRSRCGCTARGSRDGDFVERHTGRKIQLIYSLRPRFAYLSEMDQSLHLPRRAEPRPRVTGEVCIAPHRHGVPARSRAAGYHWAHRDREFDLPATHRFVGAAHWQFECVDDHQSLARPRMTGQEAGEKLAGFGVPRGGNGCLALSTASSCWNDIEADASVAPRRWVDPVRADAAFLRSAKAHATLDEERGTLQPP